MATQETEDGSCLPVAAEPVVELLDERECLGLAAGGGVGRSGCTGRFGSPVLAVSYGLTKGRSVRTGFASLPGGGPEDRIADAEYNLGDIGR